MVIKNKKWTNEQAKKIREHRALGFSYKDLHAMFGGSLSALHKLCHGKTYQDAGGPVEHISHDYVRPHYRSVL